MTTERKKKGPQRQRDPKAEQGEQCGLGRTSRPHEENSSCERMGWRRGQSRQTSSGRGAVKIDKESAGKTEVIQ